MHFNQLQNANDLNVLSKEDYISLHISGMGLFYGNTKNLGTRHVLR